ncbi:inositol monophosphatase family protein [Alteribacillus iranensis]|uniref:Inositol-1-monophosphatase n=1 Tax=Alteribacillus iranensis TaxID=930128 RepID=A0A1I2C3P8_9BACI|nr:inositol monophosphatase family protein [Alteribacillus iranensis]SFE62914.1 myo-inositol-1(or 4)-monophosphatase [Alteribacillus iranensis]
MKEWQEMLALAKEWAQEAGDYLLERAEGPMDMESKTSAIDLVTEMDVWSETFLKDKIKSFYPDHHIRTEESEDEKGQSPYEWVIDPIDGTVNYARGLPFYCISIGIRYEGNTVIGLVHAPKLNETYEAIKGEGAFLNGKEITVSQTGQLHSAVIGTGFPYDKDRDKDNNLEYINKMIPQVGGIRRMGSAALDLCQVAAGRMDGYWELKLNDWDVEAGLLIVKEAGGQAVVQPEKKGLFILSANSLLFSTLQKIIDR